MKLENQVVSLELAKKMKELGFKQESFWKHCLFIGKKLKIKEWHISPPVGYSKIKLPSGKTHNYIIEENCSAYTVAELGDMLPEVICHKDNKNSFLEICKIREEWHIEYVKDGIIVFKKKGTEADARAKMLIYLKENNLI